MVEQRIFLQDIIYDGEDYSVRKSVSISRPEAIEEMAKAICSCVGISSCKSCNWKGTDYCAECISVHKMQAEAALNTLLGK